MTAKITVVTAVINQADALRETAQSIFAQPYPNLDYIILDGGSRDGTVEVIKAYEDRLAGWLSEPDEGVYHAMNKGWAMADPDSYVLFLGAGDLLLSLPSELPGSGAVCYGRVVLDDGKEFVSYANWRLKLYNSLHHQGLLIPKKLHPEPPFDTKFRLYADFDFNQRLYKRSVKFLYQPALQSYAKSGGLTEQLQLTELAGIVRRNFGSFWWFLSMTGFTLVEFLPFLKKFRPIERHNIVKST